MATMIPTTNNSTSTTTDDVQINIFYAIFIPSLSFSTVLGNILIMVAFWKVPGLRDKPSELLILNLSCMDSLTGLQLLYYSPLFIAGHWPFGEFGCRIANAIFYLSIHGSLFNLIAISVDRVRLVLLEYPKYMKMQSAFRIRMQILACWATALMTVILEHSIWNVAKQVDESAAAINFDVTCLTPPRRLKIYSRTAFIALYIVPVITVCSLSVWFIYLLRIRLEKSKRVGDSSGSSTARAEPSTQVTTTEQRTMPSNQSNQAAVSNSHTKNQPSRSRYIKPAVSLFAVVTAMAICMLPYCFYVIIIEGCSTCYDPKIFYIMIMFKYCNAFLDPFLYGITQRKIRLFYLSKLGIKSN